MIERSGKDLSARRGDPLTADMWNRMVRSVESIGEATIGMQGGAPIKAPAMGLVVQAENIDAALEPFDVATIKGQAYTSPETHRDILLRVGVAASGDDLDLWGIVLDRIPSNTIGRVLTLGIGWAEYAPTSSGPRATISEGSRALTLGESGAGQVIEIHPTESLVLVRFPAGSGGSGTSLIERHAHRSWRYGHTVGL